MSINRIADGSFEYTGLNGARGWNVFQDAEIIQSDMHARTGKKCAYLPRNGSWIANSIQYPQQGKQYYISFYFRGSCAMQVEAYVYHRSANYGANYKYGPRLSITKEWQKYTMSVFLPEIADGYSQDFILYINAYNSTIYQGSLWVDDVVVECPDWDDDESQSYGMAGATALVGSPYILKDMPLGSDTGIYVERDERVNVLDSVLTVGMFRQWDLVQKSDGTFGWIARAHLFFAEFSCYDQNLSPLATIISVMVASKFVPDGMAPILGIHQLIKGRVQDAWLGEVAISIHIRQPS